MDIFKYKHKLAYIGKFNQSDSSNAYVCVEIGYMTYIKTNFSVQIGLLNPLFFLGCCLNGLY